MGEHQLPGGQRCACGSIRIGAARTRAAWGRAMDGRFIELGSYGTSTNDWWALLVDSAGTNLSFCTETNGSVTTNVTAAISLDQQHLASGGADLLGQRFGFCMWMARRLSNSTNGVTKWPRRSVRDQGFSVGSDATGTLQIRGVLADLETYNYAIATADDICSQLQRDLDGRGGLLGRASPACIRATSLSWRPFPAGRRPA